MAVAGIFQKRRRQVLGMGLALLLLLLFLMNHMLEAMPQQILPNDVRLHYGGRWDMRDDDCYLTGRGAVYVEADFTGRNLGICLKEDGADTDWEVSVDGNPPIPLTEDRRSLLRRDMFVIKGLSEGEHRMRLVRRTEGRTGVSRFSGLRIDRDASLSAVPPRAHLLEFVGDSITAGFRNLPDGGENGDLAFAPRLARMLEADYSVIATSGEGVIHNWNEQAGDSAVHSREDYEHFFFPRPGGQESLRWETPVRPADAVFVSLGTNDFSNAPHFVPEKEDFEKGYGELLDAIRLRQPEAIIICTDPLPDSVIPQAGHYIEAVVEQRRRAGDEKIFFLSLHADGSPLTETDYAGDGTHPTAEGAEKLAKFLLPRVQKLLHW